MRYRDHRGSLKESLKTTIEVNSVEEIISHLNEMYDYHPGRQVEEIKFEYGGWDARINWNFYYVLQKQQGDTFFTVAGMADGCLHQVENSGSKIV